MDSCSQPTDIYLSQAASFIDYLHEEGDKYKAPRLNRAFLVTAFSLSTQMSVSITLVSALRSW